MTSDIIKKEKDRQNTIFSCTNAIKHILEMKKDVSEQHIKFLLRQMLFLLTEADGLTATKRTNSKYKITYISEGVKKKREKINEDSKEYTKDLRHEHVYTRKNIVEELLNSPQKINLILKKAVGCIVTKEEDKRLSKVDSSIDGWERYKKAKIKVYNTKTAKWFNLNTNIDT
jgi:hypothetical protein